MLRLSSGSRSANSNPLASRGLGDTQALLCLLIVSQPHGNISKGSRQGAPCPPSGLRGMRCSLCLLPRHHREKQCCYFG
eukprot:278371-Amphidinium_carterae.1